MTVLINDRRAFAEIIKLERAKKAAAVGEELFDAFNKAMRHSTLPSGDNNRIFAMAELSDVFNKTVNQILIESRVVIESDYED